MSIFGNLTSTNLEETKDSLGSKGGFYVESGIYPATIKMAYVGKSDKGAWNVNFIYDLGFREYRETIYVTTTEGLNYTVRGKKKIPIKGYSTVNDICLIATGVPLSEQPDEMKTAKIHDFELKKDVLKEVRTLVELTGKSVALGILHKIDNKYLRNEATGKYEATSETREKNETDKVFHPETKQTVCEAVHQKESTFWDKWLKQNEGVTQDIRRIKEDSKPSATKTDKPKTSMFS